MKAEFKIFVFYITFHSRKKSAYAQSRASIRCAHIYGKMLCVEKSVQTFLWPFCAYASFIHQATFIPGLLVWFLVAFWPNMILTLFEI